MINIENVQIVGWEAAIRGMRNPMNSWDKSDTKPGCDLLDEPRYCEVCVERYGCGCDSLIIGPNDHDLMMRLRNAGTDHRKFMRMIIVYLDITAPLYWWKEFDTYKVGTVANSCSTMHKIHEKEFTIDDFSWEHLCMRLEGVATKPEGEPYPLDIMISVINILNECRTKFLESKDKKYWWQMIQLLPSSYNQRRTVMLNYEVLANMYHARKNHKLDEWRAFCEWIESLPYSELITSEKKMEDEKDE